MDVYTSIADLVGKSGLAALLLTVIIGGSKRMWVFGWMYEDVKKERDQWKAIALQNLKILDKATA